MRISAQARHGHAVGLAQSLIRTGPHLRIIVAQDVGAAVGQGVTRGGERQAFQGRGRRRRARRQCERVQARGELFQLHGAADAVTFAHVKRPLAHVQGEGLQSIHSGHSFSQRNGACGLSARACTQSPAVSPVSITNVWRWPPRMSTSTREKVITASPPGGHSCKPSRAPDTFQFPSAASCR
ncbi:hypothetical protein [Clavibacter phage 33]|nr:hypothetical protein [Clavibacter phage 33]